MLSFLKMFIHPSYLSYCCLISTNADYKKVQSWEYILLQIAK